MGSLRDCILLAVPSITIILADLFYSILFDAFIYMNQQMGYLLVASSCPIIALLQPYNIGLNGVQAILLF
jgi:hypothetical protein